MTHSATVTIPAASLLFASATGGSGMLGEITEFPLALTGTASTAHAFAGKPWIENTRAMDGQALVWNGADGNFYGVLNGGGAWETGVLVSFDPTTDALVLLKTLSGRTYPAKAGLGSDMFPFQKLTGFYRRPLLTPDGKGLLLLSTDGGVSMEGVLVHVNIDPASAKYLTETVVYDFFDYEVGQGSYCKSIRVSTVGGQTEMVWGKDGSGNDAVFMARVGENYEVRPENPPNEPGNCNPWVFEGTPMDRIYGRMFALRPTDPSDLSKPWAYALGYDDPARPGPGARRSAAHDGATDLLGFVRIGSLPVCRAVDHVGTRVRRPDVLLQGRRPARNGILLGSAASSLRSGRPASARHVRQLHRALLRTSRFDQSAGLPIPPRGSSPTRGATSSPSRPP